MSSTSTTILWHSFGRAHEGYRTLDKSELLSDAMASRLERFEWGQTANREYLASLEAAPAVWVEPIGKQVAVTKICEGERDSSGRATLSFNTLIIDPEFYVDQVLPKLTQLLVSDAIWRGDLSQFERMSGPPEAQRHDVVQRLTKHLEKSPKGNASLIVPDRSITLAELVSALRPLPAQRCAGLSFGFRALTDALAVDLIVLDNAYRPEPSERRRMILSRELELGELSPQPAHDSRTPSARMPVSGTTPRGRRRVHQQPLLRSTLDNELVMNAKTLTAFASVGLLVLALGIANLLVAKSNHATANTDLSAASTRIENLESGLLPELRALTTQAGEQEKRLLKLEGQLQDLIAAQQATTQSLTELSASSGESALQGAASESDSPEDEPQSKLLPSGPDPQTEAGGQE